MSTHTFWKRMAFVALTSVTVFVSYGSVSAQISMFFDGISLNFAPRSFPVSFGGGGNEFVGAILISNFEPVSPQSIVFSGGTTLDNCVRKVEGYYFNAARGLGLVPLHAGNYGNLIVTGGLYTACRGGLPSRNEIVGAVSYTLNGESLGTIVFGNTITDTEIGDNSYNPAYAPGAVRWTTQQGGSSLQLFGKMYDQMLGIGTINSSSVASVVDLIGNFTKIYIQGHVGLGQSLDKNERGVLSSTLAGTKTLLNTSYEVTTSTFINTARRNAAQWCRNTGDSQGSQNQGAIICYDGDLTIDNDNLNNYIGKDIVIRNGNVFIDATAYIALATKTLSLFIEDGHLILDNRVTESMITPVDQNGFRVSSGTGVTRGIYLNGNFIIDGLIFGGTSTIVNSGSITSVPFRTYIHGKLASLNTFTTVSDHRIRYINTKFTNLYSDFSGVENFTFHNGAWTASMEDVFSFTCTDTAPSVGLGLSGFNPTINNMINSITCPTGHEYPLMIVERNWPTLLLRQ